MFVCVFGASDIHDYCFLRNHILARKQGDGRAMAKDEEG
jgi:hypothetical protein